MFQKDSYLSSFKIYTQSFLYQDQILCAEVNNPVKQPTSTSDDQYDCFNCNVGAKGSFLFIQLNTLDTLLTICDIKIYGNFISKRGIFLLSRNFFVEKSKKKIYFI